MPVTMKKTTKADDAHRARIDRLGELLEWEQSFKKDPRMRELEALKKEIATTDEAVTTADPDAFAELEGSRYRVTFDRIPSTRKVADIHKVRAILGDETFFALASVSLGDLDKYMTPTQVASVVTVERSRARSVKAFVRTSS